MAKLGFDDVETAEPRVEFGPSSTVKVSPRKQVKIIRDWREALATIRPGEDVAWDLETGGLDPWRAPIAVISLYGARSQVPAVLHVRGSVPDDVLRFMRSPRLWVGHNVTNFDRLFLEQEGVDTFAEGVEHYDTLVGEGVAKTSGRHDVRVNLQATLNRRIGRKIAKNADHNSWMNAELDDQQLAYCVDDVMSLHRVRGEQVKKITEEGRLHALEVEQELCGVTTAMILTGLPLDQRALLAWHVESMEAAADAEDRLRSLVGGMNLGSPMKVKEAIQEHFDYELPNTQKETLEEVAEADVGDLSQFCRDVLTWRRSSKRTTMYDDEWVDKFVQVDGRIHARFWQVGTETGRFSSSEPNLEQWPRDGRKVIGGEEGMRVVAADYDAIEVMIAAALANDPQLLADCTIGEGHDGDPHMALAEFMLSKKAAEIQKEERRLAKAANFTMLFCGGWRRFHAQARLGDRNIDPYVTRRYFDQYLRRYEGIDRMRNRAFAMAHQRSVVLDFPTRLRRVLAGPEVSATRIVNNLCQGTAAAGAKYGMLELHRRGLVRGYLGSMVHDELVATVPEREAEVYGRELVESMVYGMKKACPAAPARANVKIGSHWS